MSSNAIAALFVQTGGTYYNLPGVDPWNEGRDARTYPGPFPVIAHPPCNLWCQMATLVYSQHKREDLRPGNDGGCFESALASVRQFGGVLEHPAFTKAWPAYGLQKPVGIGWNQVTDNEWVCEVWQSAYGHLARKRTWLLFVGKNRPRELRWQRSPGTHTIGHLRKPSNARPRSLNKKQSSATPVAFRDELIKLVRCE